MIKVYCAGKIAKYDWRVKLFPGIQIESQYSPFNEEGEPEGILATSTVRRGEMEYCGPFFIDCSHGCFKGRSTHNVGAWEDLLGGHGEKSTYCNNGYSPNRKTTLRMCLACIDESDVVFVWLDQFTAFGTIAEIGYAYALKKPIWLWEPWDGYDFESDIWFARSMASENRHANSPLEAFEAFTKAYTWESELKRRNEWGLERALRYLTSAKCSLGGFVYFLQAGDYVKIGKTTDLSRRLNQLSIQLPDKARLLHSIKTDNVDAAEAFYHAAFRDLRKNGEWFKIPDDLLMWAMDQEYWSSARYRALSCNLNGASR